MSPYRGLISAAIVAVIIIGAGVLVQAGLLGEGVLDTITGILIGVAGTGASVAVFNRGRPT